MKKTILIKNVILAGTLLQQLGSPCFDSRGAAGDVDLSFDPSLGINGVVTTVAFQSDGKMLIGGSFTTVKSFERHYLARINSDGSGDSTFDAGTEPQNVRAMVLQPDGKVLVGDYNGIKRFNSNGGLDASFFAETGTDPGSRAVSIISIQPDGKAIIAGSFHAQESTNVYRGLARLNSNGSFDLSFNPVWNSSLAIHSMILEPDGKVLLGGSFGLLRLNADGGYDNTFAPENQGYYITAMARQGDGKLLVGYSRFDAGTNNLVRLNVSGSIDNSFNASTDSGFIESITVQSDGKVLMKGPFTIVNGVSRAGVARLDSDGSLDEGFNVVLGFWGSVNSVFLQPDGQILAGGVFARMIGPLDRLARLKADGSLDTGFDAGRSVEPGVSSVVVQPDGKVLIGGVFTFINGTNQYGRARLNENGSFDIHFVLRTFQPQFSFPQPSYTVVGSVAVQPDGKVLVAGTHDYVTCGEEGCGYASTTFFDRVYADGLLDTNFQTSYVSGGRIRIQPDGRILVGTSAHIKRLHSSGATDSSFNSPVAGSVLALQPDGKVLVGTWNNLIVRLNSSGSLDPSFAASGAGGSVDAIALQADGKVLVGGNFTNINGTARSRMARLNANGTLDSSFNPNIQVAYSNYPYVIPAVSSITVHSDGKIYIGGAFTHVNAVARLYVARLHGDSAAVPSLNISRSNTFVVLSWPVTGLNFQLQECTNVSLTNSWSPVAQPAVTNGGRISMTAPTSAGRKFFRLESQ